jgi:endoglucanase
VAASGSGRRTRRIVWVVVAVVVVAAAVTIPIVALSGKTAPAHHAPSSTSPSSIVPANTAPEPVVVGNQIVDHRTNAPFVPRGVNWSGFEYLCAQGRGYSPLDDLGPGADQDEATRMLAWGVTTVRLPLNEDCWQGTRGAPVSDPATVRTAAGYRAAVTSFVRTLNGHGLVVILDLQSRKRADQDEFGNLAMPDAESLQFWTSVAGEFATDPSVMFDAFNEPYSRYDNAAGAYALELTWDCWLNGGCQAPTDDDRVEPLGPGRYTAVGMAAVVTTIRAAGAHQPILLGGLDYANDLREILTHLPADNQLIASIHAYPGKRCADMTCWNTELLPVAARMPLMAGEVGDDSGDQSFLESFVNWANSHNLGWLAWAWTADDDNPYSLLTSDRTEARPGYGQAVQSLLTSH